MMKKSKARYLIILTVICSLLLSCGNPWMESILEDLYGRVFTEQDIYYYDSNTISRYIARADGGDSEDDPVLVRFRMPLTSSNWWNLTSNSYMMNNNISMSGKYITLDLSMCTEGNDLRPEYINPTGFYNGIIRFYYFDNQPTPDIGGITSLILPDTTKVIEQCNTLLELRSVTIPAGVESIGGGAFDRCEQLTRVIFKGNDVIIDPRAFCYDGLDTVYNGAGTYYYSYITGWVKQ